MPTSIRRLTSAVSARGWLAEAGGGSQAADVLGHVFKYAHGEVLGEGDLRYWPDSKAGRLRPGRERSGRARRYVVTIFLRMGMRYG